jgi:hypothetical protein
MPPTLYLSQPDECEAQAKRQAYQGLKIRRMAQLRDRNQAEEGTCKAIRYCHRQMSHPPGMVSERESTRQPKLGENCIVGQ